MKKMGFVQTVATILAAYSAIGSLKEWMENWNNPFLIGSCLMYVMIVVGSMLLTLYFFTTKEKIFKYANISLVIAYLLCFADIVAVGFYMGEAPLIQIFTTGIPSVLGLLHEKMVLKTSYCSKKRKEISEDAEIIYRIIFGLLIIYSMYVCLHLIGYWMAAYYIALVLINYSIRYVFKKIIL